MSSWHDFAAGLISATCEGGIGLLVIGNSEKKNAITAAMWRAIPDALHALVDQAHARVVVISGSGADFSAGADIAEFQSLRSNAEAARIYEATNSAAFEAVRRCRVPTIAAIRGICFGGGFGLAAACDLRIADHSARFAIPAARLGLAYPADAIQDIVSSLGAQMAKMALFTGAPISAEKMAAGGFLLEAVAPDTLDAEVSSLASAIAENAPLSLHASKIAIRAVAENDEDLLREAEIIGNQTFESADYAEGRAAFLAKRKPHFIGR